VLAHRECGSVPPHTIEILARKIDRLSISVWERKEGSQRKVSTVSFCMILFDAAPMLCITEVEGSEGYTVTILAAKSHLIMWIVWLLMNIGSPTARIPNHWTQLPCEAGDNYRVLAANETASSTGSCPSIVFSFSTGIERLGNSNVALVMFMRWQGHRIASRTDTATWSSGMVFIKVPTIN